MTDNLTLLHAHEETLRAQSLLAIKAAIPLAAHMQAAQDAMNHLHALLQVHAEPGTDDHALQLVAIRVFNVGATTLKLVLSGYYQASFQLLRDAFELVNLVDLFRVDTSAIARWRTADDKAHHKEFRPVKVREALAKHPDFEGQLRHPIYESYSSHATHATYKSFKLLMSGEQTQIGPFFDEPKLRAVLEDLGAHLSHVTLGVSMLAPSSELSVLAAKSEFLEGLRAYHKKYIAL